MTIDDRSEEMFARPSFGVAMVIALVSSFGWNVIVAGDERVPLALVGIVFMFASTVGWMWCERRGRRAMAALMAVLVPLALVALWISQLGVFLIVMPLIWFGVLYGSISWGIALTVLFGVFAALFKAHAGAPPVEIYTNSTGFLPGAVFVIILGRLLIRERDARQQLRSYASQVEELATTRERNRIARDIHDSVGHYLTVVHVQIEAARAVAADPVASSECLVRAQDFAREGLSELRRSVSILRAGPAEQRPFGLALAELVEDCRSRGLETVLTVHGTPRPLTPAVEFTLFRTAQEALTNVARHATATEARCTVRYADREVVLEVADDGVGAVATEGGFGLVGLRERAQLVGGTVQIRTSPGRGFTIEVRVPT